MAGRCITALTVAPPREPAIRFANTSTTPFH